MRHVLTALFVLAAFAAGVVVTGFLGDQGKGIDLFPFVVGGILAAIVAVARTRHRAA